MKKVQQYCQESLALQQSELFKTVQLKQLFGDGKTFADARPRLPVTDILGMYDAAGVESLSDFVMLHFALPNIDEVAAKKPAQSVQAHIEQLWQVLQKSEDKVESGSLLPLANPYMIPGGRFREIYYWDSYFTALGLVGTEQHHLVEAMLENFIELQTRFGLIPNGNRSYYLTRSQPPILALLVELLMPFKQDDNRFLARCVAAMQSEYQFWMRGSESLSAQQPEHQRIISMPDGSQLNRYWDNVDTPRAESYFEDITLAQQLPQADRAAFYRDVRAACESGWDFSTRWFGNKGDITSIRTTRIVPVDLNSLLYRLESLLADYHRQLGDDEQSVRFCHLADKRKAAILKYLWCDKRGFFCDYDLDKRTCTSTMSLAGIVPLFVELAPQDRADSVASAIESTFLKTGGLITTTEQSAQQWDAPNGWAPLHWFAVKGLNNAGFNKLSLEIADRWLKTVESYFDRTGKLMEKYDVCAPLTQAGGGEYQVQEGFGWTNGVTKVLYRFVRSGRL